MADNEPIVVVEEVPSMEEVGSMLKSMHPPKRATSSSPKTRFGGIIDRLNGLFQGEKARNAKELEQNVKLVRRDPKNTKLRGKVAEMYQKSGEREKAITEYLKIAEIFSKQEQWPQAMAVYKRILKLDPAQEEVNRLIPEIYRRLGFLGDAFYQYNALLRQYHNSGNEEKSLEILGLMADLNPQKFALDDRVQVPQETQVNLERSLDQNASTESLDLEIPPPESSRSFFDLCAELQKKDPKSKHLKIVKEICTDKLFGFDEIFKELQEMGGQSRVYPNFNYQMGLACREMGFLDEAIEQFQMALERGQNPYDAAHLMGLCYREKGWWEEARQSFRKALQMESIPEEKERLVRKDLELLPSEHDVEGMEPATINGEEASGGEVERKGKAEGKKPSLSDEAWI